MSYIVEKKTIGKYLIEIHSDPKPINPREEYYNMTTMVCFHRWYDLGDKNIRNEWPDTAEGRDTFKKWYKEHKDELIAQELRLYDHSGITISGIRKYPYTDHWDSCLVGMIYVEKKRILEEFPSFKEWGKEAEKRAFEVLECDIKTYDDYLRGECYGFVVKDTEKNEEIESSWGFLGDREYCMQEAEGIVEYHIKEDKEWEEKSLTTVREITLSVEIRHSPEVDIDKVIKDASFSIESNNDDAKIISINKKENSND